jgi:hypothetical protein
LELTIFSILAGKGLRAAGSRSVSSCREDEKTSIIADI